MLIVLVFVCTASFAVGNERAQTGTISDYKYPYKQIHSGTKELDNQSLKEFFSFPIRLIIGLYRSVLGKGVRSTCPMHPSCSTYGNEAIQSAGLLIGSMRIVDRLNRCGHDTFIYPVINVGGNLKYSDPVTTP